MVKSAITFAIDLVERGKVRWQQPQATSFSSIRVQRVMLRESHHSQYQT
jgi:hypothetical protein